MSCPSELRLSAYADGELAAPERRPLEAHLIGCESCRGRVLALREEAEWLADSLQERAPRGARLPSRAAPARGLAVGGLPALAAALVVASVLGWLLDARLVPAGVGWLNPLTTGGWSDMAFDLVFLLRDAPGLLPLALAGAGILSVSTLLSFALGAAVRRWSGPGPLALLLLLAAPSPGHAHFGLHRHDDFTLAAGEVHDGPLLVSGDRLGIDGVVEGDLIAMGDRLSVRGEVRGNVFALARDAEISGRVLGAVWCVCQSARVSGRVDADLYALAHVLQVRDSARIGRSAVASGEDLLVEGEVGRDLVLAGEHAELRGQVQRDVYAWHTELALLPPARVGRDVAARVHDEGELRVESGAVVGGETRTELVPRHARGFLERYRRPWFYWLHAIGIAGAFLVGMVLHTLAPSWFGERLETGGEFFRTLGLGFLALVASPIALALLALTLVGAPLAALGFGVYLAALYLSVVLVAALVGAALLGPRPGARGFGLVLLAGLVAVTVAMHLPFVGVAASAVVALTGLGLLVRRGRDAWSARRAAATLCIVLAALAPAAGGCRTQAATQLGGGPVVRQQRVSVEPDALRKVAVIPFYPAETLEAAPPQAGAGEPVPRARWEIAAQVSNLVSEALTAQGIPVVGPSDVELAFVGEGHPVPRLDPLAAARLAGDSFGASSVVLGKVMRYREREGGAAGATGPASLAFEVSLHHVPTGRRLWTGRFDETQQSLTANVFRARQYPGGGTRWLSASEFAHWGATEVVRSLVSEPGP